MIQSPVKSLPFSKALQAGATPLIGTIVSMADQDAVEVLCSCGFDWLFLDLEHSTLTIGQAKSLLQTIGDRAYVLARVATNTPTAIQQALDIGCDGVIVPLVNSEQQALNAVRAAKYPPRGERSVGVSRAQGFGTSFDNYLSRANDEVAVILQIEHRLAVESLAEILTVEGVDAVFIGPYDLSGSLHLLGQVEHDTVKEALSKIRSICAEAAMPFGIFSMTAQGGKEEIRHGARFVALGLDLMHLYRGARAQLELLQSD